MEKEKTVTKSKKATSRMPIYYGHPEFFCTGFVKKKHATINKIEDRRLRGVERLIQRIRKKKGETRRQN